MNLKQWGIEPQGAPQAAGLLAAIGPFTAGGGAMGIARQRSARDPQRRSNARG